MFNCNVAGGQLVDILNSRGRPLPCDEVVKVFYQVVKAVQHMHKQSPPIIHRDLKVCYTPHDTSHDSPQTVAPDHTQRFKGLYSLYDTNFINKGINGGWSQEQNVYKFKKKNLGELIIKSICYTFIMLHIYMFNDRQLSNAI